MSDRLPILVYGARSEALSRGVLSGAVLFGRTRHVPVHFLEPSVKPTAEELLKVPCCGLILTVASKQVLARAAELKVPIVVTSSRFDDTGHVTVISDNEAIGRMAADYLLGRGLTQVTFLGIADHVYSRDREKGFEARLAERGISPITLDPSLGGSGGNWDAQVRYLGNALASMPQPIGVFCCNDGRARRVIEACQRFGHDIPDDFAVLGVDDDRLTCEYLTPTLSSVDPGSKRIGFEAAGLIVRMLSGEAIQPRVRRLPPNDVITRGSTDMLVSDDPLVAAAARYLRQHFHEPIDVADVVGAVPASRRTLERRFAQALGRTISRELRRLRIDHARSLLAQSDTSIMSIALSCGYTGPHQLIHAFRTEAGTTPSAYRQRFRTMQDAGAAI